MARAPATPPGPEPGRRRFLAGLALLGLAPLVRGQPAPARPAPTARATFGGIEYTSLAELCRLGGLTPPVPTSNALGATSSGGGRRLAVTADTRECQVDGLRVFLGEAVRLHQRALWVSRIDTERLLLPILARPSGPVPSVTRVCLDPGHGGQDPGTQNRELRLLEKTFVLDVAQRLRPLLARAGLQVVMTRNEDVFVPLAERPALCNRARCDLFLSIHFNATESGTVRGTEHYTLTPQHQRSTSSNQPSASDRSALPGNTHDRWNALAGYRLHRRLLQDLRLQDRGLKRARFAVLRDLQCPGVLIEAAYLSHREEARLIATTEFRTRVAQSIAAGVADYRSTLAAAVRGTGR